MANDKVSLKGLDLQITNNNGSNLQFYMPTNEQDYSQSPQNGGNQAPKLAEVNPSTSNFAGTQYQTPPNPSQQPDQLNSNVSPQSVQPNGQYQTTYNGQPPQQFAQQVVSSNVQNQAGNYQQSVSSNNQQQKKVLLIDKIVDGTCAVIGDVFGLGKALLFGSANEKVASVVDTGAAITDGVASVVSGTVDILAALGLTEGKSLGEYYDNFSKQMNSTVMANGMTLGEYVDEYSQLGSDLKEFLASFGLSILTREYPNYDVMQDNSLTPEFIPIEPETPTQPTRPESQQSIVPLSEEELNQYLPSTEDPTEYYHNKYGFENKEIELIKNWATENGIDNQDELFNSIFLVKEDTGLSAESILELVEGKGKEATINLDNIPYLPLK